ncbi:uncharacterized protein LOC120076875 [Benincasa hispida]|uniref:uncharacterized protein LOC120076875 n=1 Tax=Benincasa hispida TaxID=102211 RepID=UPI001901C802|nr:uncharacterized protein LOC120076875 [Benincasa hispida]
METIQLLLSLAAQFKWAIYQMDVKSAFLNGVLEEEIYTEKPPGYMKFGKENKEAYTKAILKRNKMEECKPVATPMELGTKLSRFEGGNQVNAREYHSLVSKAGLEVNQAKIDAIANLPPPVNVKTLRSFLGHAGFYRRFIRNFSQIARPLSALLEVDLKYEFDDAYAEAFHTLRKTLITAPILVVPDWTQSFALMCNASGYARKRNARSGVFPGEISTVPNQIECGSVYRSLCDQVPHGKKGYKAKTD